MIFIAVFAVGVVRPSRRAAIDRARDAKMNGALGGSSCLGWGWLSLLCLLLRHTSDFWSGRVVHKSF